MSEQSFYEKLGVTEDASFEEIQEARKLMIQQHRGDQKRLEIIEAAYDAILMERLKMRQEGKIKVPERIRFPEKLSQSPPSFPTVPVKRSPEWLQRLIDTPSLTDVLWSTGCFSVLSLLVVLYPANAPSNLPLVVAFGVGFTLFFINRKERQFLRSLLLTFAGLFIGIGLGTLLGGWLLPQIDGIGLTLDKLAALVTFFILWVIASFLR